jgi:hypothetical protein
MSSTWWWVEKPILVYRQMPDESVTLPPVNQCIIVSCRSTCFVDIRAVHIVSGTHMKGTKLLDAGKKKLVQAFQGGHMNYLPGHVHRAFRGASGPLIR